MELRGLSIDVTRIKSAQEEADRAVQVRDEFLSIASHEIRTPLTPLRLKLELMQRMVKAGVFDAPQIAKLTAALDKSCYQVDRLARLTDELLDVSRINGGKFTLVKEPVELSDVVRDVCDRFRGDLSRSGCELRLSLNRARGMWDRLKVEQVVINLLTNALKYGEAKPIEITTGERNGMAVLQVRDHGIGIREEDHDRIFTLYERAVSPMNYGGLGLGLYIVKKITEAHGGSVVVQSKPRDGSAFTVQLPFAEVSVMKQAHV
jgi:signal transduction histidine kinase